MGGSNSRGPGIHRPQCGRAPTARNQTRITPLAHRTAAHNRPTTGNMTLERRSNCEAPNGAKTPFFAALAPWRRKAWRGAQECASNLSCAAMATVTPRHGVCNGRCGGVDAHALRAGRSSATQCVARADEPLAIAGAKSQDCGRRRSIRGAALRVLLCGSVRGGDSRDGPECAATTAQLRPAYPWPILG